MEQRTEDHLFLVSFYGSFIFLRHESIRATASGIFERDSFSLLENDHWVFVSICICIRFFLGISGVGKFGTAEGRQHGHGKQAYRFGFMGHGVLGWCREQKRVGGNGRHNPLSSSPILSSFSLEQAFPF